MKKLTIVVSMILVLSFLLTACATPTPETIIQTVEVPGETIIKTVEVPGETVIQTQEVIKEVPAERTEVRLSGWASSPSETALLESLLYKFSVANPDIVVKYEPITGDFWATIKTMVASGTEPDVYYMDIFQFPAFAKDEVLLALDDLMAQAGTNKADFIPSLLESFSSGGMVYGIPKDFNTLGMFYNKDLFDKAGLEYPTDAWTWDDLKNAATKTTDLSDANKPVYGFCVPADAGRFPVFAFQNGGSIMNEDASDTTLDSAETIAAGEFYTSFRKDKIGAIPADMGEGWQGTLFGKGQCAMVYEGGWLIPYLTQQFPNTKYGVSQLPAGPGGKGNLIFTVAYSIAKDSKNPEAAYRVVEFLTNAESQQTVLESGFALPTRVALQESDYLKNNPNSAAIFNGALEGARPFMWGLAGSDVNEQMGKALESVYLKDTSVADAFKNAAEIIRQKIAELK